MITLVQIGRSDLSSYVLKGRGIVAPTPSIVPFHELKDSPLGVDTTYQGGSKGHAGDDPISKLLKVGISGGFRISGTSDLPRFIVLYTSLEHRDWPDSLDLATGTLTYYGDKRET